MNEEREEEMAKWKWKKMKKENSERKKCNNNERRKMISQNEEEMKYEMMISIWMKKWKAWRMEKPEEMKNISVLKGEMTIMSK